MRCPLHGAERGARRARSAGVTSSRSSACARRGSRAVTSWRPLQAPNERAAAALARRWPTFAHRDVNGTMRYSRTTVQSPVWVTAQALTGIVRKPFPLIAAGL